MSSIQQYKTLNGTSRSSSSSLQNPTPQQLRRLVLQYLLQHCYVDTARVFAESKDMNTLLEEAQLRIPRLDGDGDSVMDASPEIAEAGIARVNSLDESVIESTKLRRSIRDAILSGRIETARNLLEEHFPSVLNSSTHMDALQAYSRPTCDEQSSYRLSLDPTHLSLNLRIQSFIESVRTRPLIYMPASSSSTEAADVHFTPPTIEKTLALAQQLFALVARLPDPDDRTIYNEEVNKVGSLMAYTVPESSPVSKYLTMQRRSRLADQINSAILYRTGQAPVSKLQRMVQATTHTWAIVGEEALMPDPSNYPAGLTPPLKGPPIGLTYKQMMASKYEGSKSFPPYQQPLGFDLAYFLSQET